MDVVTVKEADSPLLVSFPHSGTYVPGAIAQHFTPTGKRLIDTDWHVPKLYDFFRRVIGLDGDGKLFSLCDRC